MSRTTPNHSAPSGPTARFVEDGGSCCPYRYGYRELGNRPVYRNPPDCVLVPVVRGEPHRAVGTGDHDVRHHGYGELGERVWRGRAGGNNEYKHCCKGALLCFSQLGILQS